MESFGDTLLNWWPVITAFFVGAWWVSRSIAKLEAQNDKLDTRMENAEKKLTSLFDLWNNHIDRLLNERDKK
jgi:hypothetical protein